MASYDHQGYTITRTPIAMTVEDRETTGWAFDVRCPQGQLIPIVVEALDRKKGLRETRKEIDRFIASTNVAAFALAQS